MSSVEEITAPEETASDATAQSGNKSRVGLVRWYTDLNIGTKILMPITVACAVAVLVGMCSWWTGTGSNERADSLYNDNVRGVAALGDVREALAGVRISARDLALAHHPSDKNEAQSAMDANRAA